MCEPGTRLGCNLVVNNSSSEGESQWVLLDETARGIKYNPRGDQVVNAQNKDYPDVSSAKQSKQCYSWPI